MLVGGLLQVQSPPRAVVKTTAYCAQIRSHVLGYSCPQVNYAMQTRAQTVSPRVTEASCTASTSGSRAMTGPRGAALGHVKLTNIDGKLLHARFPSKDVVNVSIDESPRNIFATKIK